MMDKKVAIVTGSAKGIGFEIVKKLCQEFNGDVFLTARNSENGKKAVEKLKKLGLNPIFYELNVVDHFQVEEFAQFIGKTYGGVDILVNNAAVLYKKSDRLAVSQLVNEQIETNFTSVLSLINAFFPWFRSNARIVNVSSRMGTLWYVKNKQLKDRFRDPKLSLDELIDIMEDYINAANQGAAAKLGYPNSNMGSYTMSKLGVNALTRIVQNIFDHDKTRKGIIVSAVCPGYCRTDMSKGRGILSAARGAETPVHFCLLSYDWDGPKGAFWGENKKLDWEKGGLIESFFPMVKKIFMACLMCPFNFFKKEKRQRDNYVSFA